VNRDRRLDVSVVVPALNAATTIGDQLEALAAQVFDGSWEVIVVDNGSVDGTADVCRGLAGFLPRLRVVTCDERGTSAARNAGAALADGDVLLFCDADDAVDARWVASMFEALRRSDAVGGAVENERLSPGRPEHLPRHPSRLPVVAGFLPRSLTANLGVRRDVFEALGGFNREYDYGSDDTEFCWRLQLASYRLEYAPAAVVHYRHRDSLRGTAIKAYRTGRSRGRLYRDFARAGMPRPRIAGALYRAALIGAATALIPFSPRMRWWWADQAPAAVGRLVGSIAFRVVYL
jgi:glycosyltransferase involved in cell wall biosynthesis